MLTIDLRFSIFSSSSKPSSPSDPTNPSHSGSYCPLLPPNRFRTATVALRVAGEVWSPEDADAN